MKFVRTVRGYQALALEGVTITGTPQELSEKDAAAAVKAGDEYGAPVLSFDTEDDARADLTAPRGVAEPDLSAGRAAIYGTGDPVQTPGVTPTGDTPDQAAAGQKEK